MILYFASAIIIGGIVFQLGKYSTLLAIILTVTKMTAALIGLGFAALVLRKLYLNRLQKPLASAKI